MSINVKLTDLAPGGEAGFTFRFASVADGVATLLLLDDAGASVGTVMVTLADGTFTGGFNDLASVEVIPTKQSFVPGDVVYLAAVDQVFLVWSVAEDLMTFSPNPGGSNPEPTADVVKVGHFDIAALTIPG